MCIINNGEYNKRNFKKYDDKISRIQYKHFDHISTQHLSNKNHKKMFKLGLENEFLSKNIKCYIAGEFSPIDASETFNDKTNIKMVDNFVAHLFSHIEVKKHGSLLMK